MYLIEYVFELVALLIVIFPIVALARWYSPPKTGALPVVKIAMCGLGSLLIILYAMWGPFYDVVPLTDPATPEEYFRDLDVQEKPITLVLSVLFFLQFVLLGILLATSSKSQIFLILSFGLVGILCSLIALTFAGYTLYIGGLT